MAINTIATAELFQQKLDKQMLVGSVTGFMEANAGEVIYNGGDTVKMPVLSTAGLKAYDRDKGFTTGAVTLKYEDYKLTQDRGRTFLLDAMTVDESNFVANAANVMGEFQRAQVIPEIDAYRMSRIAALADDHKKSVDLTAENILAELDEAICKIQDEAGDSVELVIMMNTKVRNILNNAKGIDKHINAGEFKAGEISRKVKVYDDIPIIGVPSSRMKTAYNFEEGFVADGGAKSINFVVMPVKAPIAISKTEKVRIFTPDQNQTADAWKLDYRKFHDIWIPKQQLATVQVSVAQS